MLGLFFLYWIGKYYYKLAELYNKNNWGYALLGIATYYGGILITGFIVGIFLGLFFPDVLDTINETLLGLLMLPFGGLSCYLLYKYLEKSWKKSQPNTNELIDEIGKPNLPN